MYDTNGVQDGVSPVSVVPVLSSRDKWTAISELISLSPSLSTPHGEKIRRAVVARERINSTGLGRGVAFAHGELKGISSLLVGVGVSIHGIDFSAVDRKPVHLLFVFATPPAQRSQYLRTMATVCRLARQEGLSPLWDGTATLRSIEITLSPALDPLR